MKKFLQLIAFVLISVNTYAQQTPIDYIPANDGAVILTCDGFIIDSGGQGGSGYGNNENVTITICPDTITTGNNDDMISIVFNLFNLDTYDDNPAPNVTNVDVINIYLGWSRNRRQFFRKLFRDRFARFCCSRTRRHGMLDHSICV